MASEYRGDNSSLSWQTDYDYDRYGNRTSVSGIGYLAQAGSSGILPAMSALSVPPAVAGGSSAAITQLIDPRVTPLDEQLAARSDLESPAALLTATQRSTPNAHHARASKLPLATAASPQGPPAKIAFASHRDGSAQVYLMNTDGTGQTRLSANTTNDESPSWSPDNSRILFQSDRDNPFCRLAEIYVMNADGSGQTRLTNDVNDDSAPVWSPDGTKIAFQSMRNGINYQVYMMNADGSGQMNISNSAANDIQPSWSPDGTKIAFGSDRDQAAFSSIYVMNANGSNQTRLTFSGSGIRDEQPIWSPDGSKLAFVSTRDSIVETWTETDDDGIILTRSRVNTNKEIYLMNADGSAQVRLTNTLENDDSPAWSPDGTKIVFRSERDRDCCDPTEQVWIMNIDGSSQVNLSNSLFSDCGPSWQRIGNNALPTVNLTSPANGASFTAPANITITANASDSDGTISRVDFYQGTAWLGTATSAPYSFDWTNVPAGSYSLTATATDNGGATTISTAVSITVNTVATVSYDSTTNRITTAGISYDAAGQILSDAKFRGLQYQYDPNGRMIWSANLDGSNPATAVYDGLGQRVQTTHAGVTKTYFYDINGSVIAEYEAASGTGYGYGVLKRLNVCGGGRLLAVDEVQTTGTKVTSYLMGDRQGSTRVLTDAAGAVTSRHDYLPFGEELGAGTGAPGSPTGMRTTSQGYSVSDNVRQRYADTRLDDATGLDHTLWRKLETRSGRWSTPDPYGASLRVADPQSFNRYAYVHNDPVNFVDPSGLSGYTVMPLSDAEICRIFNICGGGGLPGMMGSDTGMMIELPSPEGPGEGGGDPQNPEVPLGICEKDLRIF